MRFVCTPVEKKHFDAIKKNNPQLLGVPTVGGRDEAWGSCCGRWTVNTVALRREKQVVRPTGLLGTDVPAGPDKGRGLNRGQSQTNKHTDCLTSVKLQLWGVYADTTTRSCSSGTKLIPPCWFKTKTPQSSDLSLTEDLFTREIWSEVQAGCFLCF